MNSLKRILKEIFLHVPLEILAGLWRLILLLLLILLYLLRFLFGWLRKKKGEKSHEPRCTKVPENIKRKPDPCLYSQFYRMSQGLSVTWNNPDIWITTPDGTVVESSALKGDSDYIVNVQIHDASFDPALATQVRCFYRPWSFNSPLTTPVETNPDGTERVVILHIGAWSAEVARFRWHTPAQGGHYCLQAQCYHPDDKNPNNNLGQENTTVHSATANMLVSENVLLVNRANTRREFMIFADRFAMPEGETQLRLKTFQKPFRKEEAFDFVKKGQLVYDITQSRLKTAGAKGPFLVRYAWTGWDELRERMRRGNFTIGREWELRINNVNPENSVVRVVLNPGEQRMIPIQFRIPADVQRGQQLRLNFTAWSDHGKTLGGVTFKINIE